MKILEKKVFSIKFLFMLIPVLCLITGISIPLINYSNYSERSSDLKIKSHKNENISKIQPRLSCPETPLLNQTNPKEYGKIDSFKKENQIENTWYRTEAERIKEEEYNISYDDRNGAYQSPNRANNIRFIYHKNGFTAVSREEKREINDMWSVDLRVSNVNRQKSNNKSVIFNDQCSKINDQFTDFSKDELFVFENQAYIDNDNLRINYKNIPEGMRQDFIIRSKPEGLGNLRLKISVDTKLKMIAGADALIFKDNKNNEKMKYSALKAWDANSRELRAFFENNSQSQTKSKIKAASKSFTIVINDEDAVYPITIDPLSTSPVWTADANQDYAHFGISVSTAGDVNGDGYSDVIIGANEFDNGQINEGMAFVYYGSATGLSSYPNWTAEGNQNGAEFGTSVCTAGDVNNDGYSDVIIGAARFDNGETNEGGALVYHGSSMGLLQTPGWSAEGNQNEAVFGSKVSTAGDINGDGYSDVIVSALWYDNDGVDQGKVFVYKGSSAGLSNSPSWTEEGNQSNSSFGNSVSCAGDVNGDGYSDVIISDHTYDNGEINEGKAFLYHGSVSGLSSSPNWTFEGNLANAYFGWGASAAGDVNGDGYSDIIVGAPYYSGQGRVYVFHGSTTGIHLTPNLIIESDQAYSEFGESVSTAGDVNGDGYSDIIIGSCLYSNGEFKEGKAFVHLGSAAGMTSNSYWVAESNQPEAEFGISVSTAGDVNGDGYSDIIAGAFYYDNGQTDEGKSFVYHGSPSGLSLNYNWSVESNQTAARLGLTVSSAGDVNGDGYSDVIIGANEYDNGETDEGKAFVYHGSATGLSATPNWTAEGNQTGALFGSRVSTAGDVNGDGFADVIVGAARYDNGETDVGKAFVYYGSFSGLSLNPDWTALGNQAGALFSYPVSAAGDVNGDGYSDVIITAVWYDNGQTDEGRVYVYHGSASGLSDSPNWITESNQANSEFGISIGCAGDVNGDGFSDVLIGANSYDNGEINEGKTFAYYGSALGLSLSPDWTFECNLANAYLGWSAASAGDINADGFSDVIVGAPYYSDKGRLYIFNGSETGLTSTPTSIIDGDQNGSAFGGYVATAGDVNGDGYSDIIAGAFLYSNNEYYEGRVYLYSGSPAGIKITPDWFVESDQMYAKLGISVSSAGDVNGDGYSDVIAGAFYFDNDQYDEGKVFVYYGNEGTGMRSTVNQNNITSGGIVYSGGLTGTDGNVSLKIFGKSSYGRAKGRIVYEYRKNSEPFSGNIITNSTGFSGSGNFFSLGISGFELWKIISGLSNNFEYKWRARVQYELSGNPYQKFGPWKYYSNFVPMPYGGFKARQLPLQARILTLYAVIQGFYDPETNVMNKDTVSVYVRQFNAPFNIVDSAKLYLNAAGMAIHSFNSHFIINNTLYYLVIKHRNSLETWNIGSAFVNSVQEFSFRNFGSAFGNNQIHVDVNPETYAIYGGDVNQNGIIDLNDVLLVYNDANIFATGYIVTDLTGNDLTDLNDIIIAYNNSVNFVSVIRP